MASDLTTKIVTTRMNMASDFDYALHQLLTELSQSHDALADRVAELEKREPAPATATAEHWTCEKCGHRNSGPICTNCVTVPQPAPATTAGWTFDQCKWSQKKQDDQPAPTAVGWTATGGTWGRELPLNAAWYWVESERDGSHSVVYLDPANCSVRNFKRWARIPFPDQPARSDAGLMARMAEAARMYRKIVRQREYDESEYAAEGQTYGFDHLNAAAKALDAVLAEYAAGVDERPPNV